MPKAIKVTCKECHTNRAYRKQSWSCDLGGEGACNRSKVKEEVGIPEKI